MKRSFTNEGSKAAGIFALAFGFCLMAALWAVLLALPLMLLWNFVVPGLFGLKAIGFGQALCLNLLSQVLFQSSSSSSKEG